jgi:hypothetical protein
MPKPSINNLLIAIEFDSFTRLIRTDRSKRKVILPDKRDNA